MFAAIVDWRVALVSAGVLGIAALLAVVTLRLLAAARPESPALVRLEVMSLRRWGKADEAAREEMLAAAEAEPIGEFTRRPVQVRREKPVAEQPPPRPRRHVPRDPERLTNVERVATISSLRGDESAELPVVDEVDYGDDWLVRADDTGVRPRERRRARVAEPVSDDDDGPIDPLL